MLVTCSREEQKPAPDFLEFLQGRMAQERQAFVTEESAED